VLEYTKNMKYEVYGKFFQVSVCQKLLA